MKDRHHLAPEHRAAARAIGRVAARVRLLGCATPSNLRAELARAEAAWSAGREDAPRFTYARPPELSAERAALAVIEEGCAGPGAHGTLLAGRARQLGVEAAACEVVGTPAFWGRARERFPRRDRFDDEADRVADAWSREPLPAPSSEHVASDDERDPRSLLRSMQRAIGERRLPFRAVVSAELAPLAATGDAVILVAAGRRLTADETARTVLHEIEGHALPAARSRSLDQPLFEAGTAFGSDDQEGRALLVEDRAAFLGAARRRELALRHVGARSVEARADFVETARLLRRRGADTGEALRIAARVHRGGGLAREAAYLPAYLRVREALAKAPNLEDLLASGRISVEAARRLAGSSS